MNQLTVQLDQQFELVGGRIDTFHQYNPLALLFSDSCQKVQGKLNPFRRHPDRLRFMCVIAQRQTVNFVVPHQVIPCPLFAQLGINHAQWHLSRFCPIRMLDGR
jgi:hypothetical protein